jgi:hypothetical protein
VHLSDPIGGGEAYRSGYTPLQRPNRLNGNNINLPFSSSSGRCKAWQVFPPIRFAAGLIFTRMDSLSRISLFSES